MGSDASIEQDFGFIRREGWDGLIGGEQDFGV